jgi:hypothetical protein
MSGFHGRKFVTGFNCNLDPICSLEQLDSVDLPRSFRTLKYYTLFIHSLLLVDLFVFSHGWFYVLCFSTQGIPK